jgi:hypothetical protein
MIYAESLCVDLERQIKEKQMGRPINKRWFGATGTGTGTGLFTGNNLPIRFKSGGTVYEGFVLKQRNQKVFKYVSKTNRKIIIFLYIKSALNFFDISIKK